MTCGFDGTVVILVKGFGQPLRKLLLENYVGAGMGFALALGDVGTGEGGLATLESRRNSVRVGLRRDFCIGEVKRAPA